MRVLSTSVHGLEMPVGECPCIARGACPFLCPWSAWSFVFTAHLHMYNKFVLQYCIGTKKRRPPRTTVERIFCASPEGRTCISSYTGEGWHLGGMIGIPWPGSDKIIRPCPTRLFFLDPTLMRGDLLLNNSRAWEGDLEQLRHLKGQSQTEGWHGLHASCSYHLYFEGPEFSVRDLGRGLCTRSVPPVMRHRRR